MANIYCEYCGAQLKEDAKFCSNCGAPAPMVSEEEPDKTYEADHDRQTVVEGEGTYSIVLGSLGNCTKAAAGDLLEDLLGYTDEEAAELLNVIPALAAQQLTYEQARYVAQAMTEYGMEVSIRNGEEYVEADEDSGSSVFDGAGTLLTNVAAVLATLSAANRMRYFRRYDRPDFRQHMYVPRRPLPVRKPSLISRIFRMFGGKKRSAGPAPGMAPRRPGAGIAPRRPLQTGFTFRRDYRPDERRRRMSGTRPSSVWPGTSRPFADRPGAARPSANRPSAGRPGGTPPSAAGPFGTGPKRNRPQSRPGRPGTGRRGSWRETLK